MVSQDSASTMSTSRTRTMAAKSRSMRCGSSRHRSPSARDAVSDMAHRLDDVLAELGPQSRDGDVDDVAAGIERVPPYLAEELLAGAHRSRPTHEVLQQQELARAQLDVPAVDEQPAAEHVEVEVADVERVAAGRRPWRRQPGTHPRAQLTDRERLAHVVDGAPLEARDARLGVAHGGHDH